MSKSTSQVVNLNLSPDTRLGDAQERLRETLNKGAICPCCGQVAKIYKRPLNRSNAKTLIALEVLCRGNKDYFHISDLLEAADVPNTIGREFAIARFWGLIEEEPKDQNEFAKKTSGRWRITPVGRLFAIGELEIQKYALMFNRGTVGLTGDLIKIADCFQEGFSYPEAMSPAVSE